MTASIFLVSSNAWDKHFLSKIALLCGLKLTVAQNLDELSGLSDSDELTAIFIDSDLSSVPAEFLNLFSGVFPREKVHLLLGQKERVNAAELTSEEDIGNLVLRPYTEDQISAETAAQDYSRIIDSNFKHRGEQLISLFSTENKIVSKDINDSLQKRFIVDAVNSELETRSWTPKICNYIANSVDELIMNAIFDAPQDGGTQIHRLLARSAAFQLQGQSVVTIQFAIENRIFAATISDQFGTLDRSTLFQFSTRAFTGPPKGSVGNDTQGAGLGLSLIMRYGGSIRLLSRRGFKTDMTVVFRRTESAADFRRQFQFISTYCDF